MERYFYLHGFASSPCSTKAIDLHDRFTKTGIDLQIPDLNQGDFSHLTLTRQIQQVAAELPSADPVVLIGSSLGGLTAAWVGDRHPQVQQVILLAPAFQFLAHWLPKLGQAQIDRWQQDQFLSVHHYGEGKMLPLHYDFLTDAAQYRDADLQRPVPTLILHGQADATIPIQASRDYAADRSWVKLVELDSDHSLHDVMEKIWYEIQHF